MSEFRSVPEEVHRLLTEVQETKEALQAISARLAALEKHVRRVFQIPKPVRVSKPRSSPQAISSLGREQLLARFDGIRSAFVGADPSAADNILVDFAEDDLRALARELGVSNTRKLSMANLRAAVLQKVHESALLGTGALRGTEESTRADSDTGRASDVTRHA